MNPLRIALFTDSFHEVNGAAHTCRQYQAFAERRGLPLLVVHSGPETRCFQQGPVATLELKRSRAAIAVDVDFGFDPLLWLHWPRIGKAIAGAESPIHFAMSRRSASLVEQKGCLEAQSR